MASAVDSNKLASTQKILAKTITGGTTVVGTYRDLAQFSIYGVLVAVADLTGAGVTKVEILAAVDTSGTSATVVKDSGTVAANAVNDQVFLECTADEIIKLANDGSLVLRYVAVRVTLANAADVAVATEILTGACYQQDDLTPATTIA